MEVTINWFQIASSTISVVIILTGVWRIVNWVWLKPKKLEKCLRQQGFNGNSYKLWYGDLKENSSMLMEAKAKPINLSDDIVPRVFPIIHKTVMNYGKNSFVWIGTTPRLNILDPELLKDVFTKIDTYQKPMSNPLVRLFVRGLATYNDDQWAKHRRIISPAFHLEKLKNMLPAFHISCSQMIKKWENSIGNEGLCEIDVFPHLQDMTSDVISRTSFGSSYEEGRRIFQLLTEQARLTYQFVQSTYIPGWRFLPTRLNKRMKVMHNEIHGLVKSIINKREKATKLGKATSHDLLGLLLESNFQQIHEHGLDKTAGMTVEEVIDECKLFYFAGQETTSVLLVWTMVLLSIHKKWQTLAREEVLHVLRDGAPNSETLNRLKIVTMIFYEVLRLYPPVPMLSRAIKKDTNLGKFTLPAGVLVSVPAIIVQTDHEHWGEDAKEFNPERFSEGLSKAMKSQFAFFPFSSGPRVCIGQNFAMIEAKMALAMILQRFWFELSPSYAHAPAPALTLQPQFGAHLILHRLK